MQPVEGEIFASAAVGGKDAEVGASELCNLPEQCSTVCTYGADTLGGLASELDILGIVPLAQAERQADTAAGSSYKMAL